MGTARTLRWLGCLPGIVALAGCQADPAPLARVDAAANRPSVLQLVSAQEPADPTQAEAARPAVSLDRAGLDAQLPDAPAHDGPAPQRSAVLLDPPQSLLRATDAAAQAGADAPEAGGPQLTSVGAYLEVARLAQQRGLTALAEKYYFKAVHAYPDAAVAWNDLGQFYRNQKQYAKAVHATQMAVQLEPASHRYHNNLGELLVRAGRLDEGIKEFQIAVGDAAAHYNAGAVLHAMGKHSESVRLLRVALDKDPNLRQAQLALGQLAPGLARSPRRDAATSAAASNHRPAVNARPPQSTHRHVATRTGPGERTFTERLRRLFRWGDSRSDANQRDVAGNRAANSRPPLFGFLRPDRTQRTGSRPPGARATDSSRN